MGKRHPNPRLVKIHRSYSVDEIARLFGIHKNTVRAWQRAGLHPIDHRRPVRFLGRTLAAYLEDRRTQAKRPLRPGQIYCLPCRERKEPALGLTEYIALTPTSGNLRGLCPTCERWIYRRVNRTKLFEIAGSLEITIAEALPTLRDSAKPSVNSDFKRKDRP